MFYTHYRGRSVGRLIGVLESYGWLNMADYATYGEGKVMYQGKLWATYEWDGDTDVPIFKFVADDEDGWRTRTQNMLRPFVNFPSVKYMNAAYTVQEIARIPDPSDVQVESLMRQWLYGWDDADFPKYVEHFKACAKSLRDYHDWRRREIENNGGARAGTYLKAV